MDETNQSSKQSNIRELEKTLSHTMTLLVVCIILALASAGFGIYGTIQANRALSYLEANDLTTSDLSSDDELTDDELTNDDSSDELSFAKPTSASDIEYISIAYNNGQDYIDIENDGSDSTIDYYTITEDEDLIENNVTSGVTEIIQYIFDNNLEYLGENEYNEEDAWSIEVDTEDGYSYVGGTDSAPEWFNDLLKKLDVDKNGYQSRK